MHSEQNLQAFWENMERSDYLLIQAKQLVSRLERISADSTWAHRSSGHRGALLRWIQEAANGPDSISALNGQATEQLEELIKASYILIEKAARDMVR